MKQALGCRHIFLRVCQQLHLKTHGKRFSILHRTNWSECNSKSLTLPAVKGLFQKYPVLQSIFNLKVNWASSAAINSDCGDCIYDRATADNRTTWTSLGCRGGLSIPDLPRSESAGTFCSGEPHCRFDETCSKIFPNCDYKNVEKFKTARTSAPYKTRYTLAICKKCQSSWTYSRYMHMQNNILCGRNSALSLHIFKQGYSSIRESNNDGKIEESVRLKPPWRIMFFGTDEIAEWTLRELYHNMSSRGTLVESLEVVTVKEQKAIRRFAESVDLKIHGWPIKIEHGKFDVGVLVSFGHLIPDAVIHMFPFGILNMHPSLLPRWRGASPVIHTILHGDEVTGVSIMDIRPKHFDIGPVLLQRRFPVPDRCTSFQLANIVGHFGAHMMLECLKDLPKLERFEQEQELQGVTYAHKIKHVNSNIDWENQTAYQVDCQYRALAELMPLKTVFEDHVVKLLDVVEPNVFKDLSSRDIRGYRGNITCASPGTVVFHRQRKCLVVKCKDGFIGFRALILRKKITAADFYNGYLNRRSWAQFTSIENDLNKYISQEKTPVEVKV